MLHSLFRQPLDSWIMSKLSCFEEKKNLNLQVHENASSRRICRNMARETWKILSVYADSVVELLFRSYHKLPIFPGDFSLSNIFDS